MAKRPEGTSPTPDQRREALLERIEELRLLPKALNNAGIQEELSDLAELIANTSLMKKGSMELALRVIEAGLESIIADTLR